MQIYVINGYPRAGKDQFVNYAQIFMGDDYCRAASTVDRVKRIARDCGWNGDKTPEDRKFLSDLKDLLTEWRDLPLYDIQCDLYSFQRIFDIWEINSDGAAFFIHCREPKEIQKIVDKFGAKTIYIQRDKVASRAQSNYADEANMNDFKYDYIINNNGTLQDYAGEVLKFLKNQGLHIAKDTYEFDLFGNLTLN